MQLTLSSSLAGSLERSCPSCSCSSCLKLLTASTNSFVVVSLSSRSSSWLSTSYSRQNLSAGSSVISIRILSIINIAVGGRLRADQNSTGRGQPKWGSQGLDWVCGRSATNGEFSRKRCFVLFTRV